MCDIIRGAKRRFTTTIIFLYVKFETSTFKSVIEQLNGKQLVMRLLTHEDPNVRYHALLSVQKIMVHNWYYVVSRCKLRKFG